MRLSRLSGSWVLAAGLVALSCGGGGRTPPPKTQAPPTPAPSVAATPADRAKLDVPYVPTPEAVVERMLQLAKVGRDDFLYALGCGAGRIVITAARKHGARGVCIDIDPARIKEARENAREAGAADRIEFIRQDLFESDLKAEA